MILLCFRWRNSCRRANVCSSAACQPSAAITVSFRSSSFSFSSKTLCNSARVSSASLLVFCSRRSTTLVFSSRSFALSLTLDSLSANRSSQFFSSVAFLSNCRSCSSLFVISSANSFSFSSRFFFKTKFSVGFRSYQGRSRALVERKRMEHKSCMLSLPRVNDC